MKPDQEARRGRGGVLMKEKCTKVKVTVFHLHNVQSRGGKKKQFQHSRLGFIPELFSQSSFKRLHMATDVSVNFTVLSLNRLTLVPLSAATCLLQCSCLDSSPDVLTPAMQRLLIAVKL